MFTDSTLQYTFIYKETNDDITMTSYWARWRFKSPASPLFTRPLIQAEIKVNFKASRSWPLCGDRWIPRTNCQ